MNRRNSFRAACKLVMTAGATKTTGHLYETLNRPALYEKRSKNTLTPSSLQTVIISNILPIYSSSSNAIASRVVCSSSYSSLLPTIMFSNSRKPVPAGIG